MEQVFIKIRMDSGVQHKRFIYVGKNIIKIVLFLILKNLITYDLIKPFHFQMKSRLGRLKKSYRGAVKYSNIGINKNGRLYDKKNGKFVKETEDLKKLKNE